MLGSTEKDSRRSSTAVFITRGLPVLEQRLFAGPGVFSRQTVAAQLPNRVPTREHPNPTIRPSHHARIHLARVSVTLWLRERTVSPWRARVLNLCCTEVRACNFVCRWSNLCFSRPVCVCVSARVRVCVRARDCPAARSGALPRGGCGCADCC